MGKKPKIMPGCIGCGLCQSVAPKVFRVKDVSRVREDADCKNHEQEIKKAVASCPVRVIVYESEKE